MGEPVQQTDLERLLRAILASADERSALLSALSDAKILELFVLAAHEFRETANVARADQQAILDTDEVAGVWGLRISAGSLVAGLGLVVTSTVTGGLALAAVTLPVLAVGGAGAGRLALKRSAREHEGTVQAAETLANSIDKLKSG